VQPTAEELAGIALQAGELAAHYAKDTTRIAFLSYSCFGSKRQNPDIEVIQEAVRIVKGRVPKGVEVDGEVQADAALDMDLMTKDFPFSSLTGPANVLIFPNLSASNIGYKLVAQLAQGAVLIGPILTGIAKPASVIQRGGSVVELVNLIYATAHQAVLREKSRKKVVR
jgi:malate dehydrogenase (oxaloacetate-decarboxylating)(NADP+)